MATEKKLFPFAINTLNKLGALFCFIATIFTLGFAIIFNESLLSDDPYIIGWAAACLVLPGFLGYYIAEEFNFKNINKNNALCLYSVLPFAYFFNVYINGGESSSYAAMFTIVYVLALTISYLALK